MTSSISDTLAMAKDTIARVKILEQDSIISRTDSDSAAVEYTRFCNISRKDTINTSWSECDSCSTFQFLLENGDTTQHSISPVKETPGVYGIPYDNDITHSDIVSSLVILCFIVTMTIFSFARDYISNQTKKFFNKISKSRSFTAETINEVKLNIYFTIQTSLLLSIITYTFAVEVTDGRYTDFPLTLIIPAATLMYLLYFTVKYILYMMTDCIFYEEKKIRKQHSDDLCYIMTVQGLFLFPALLISISTGMEAYSLAIYLSVVIVLAKLLSFYKTICTFSGHYTSILQIILYFCALEMIPLMSIIGILAMTVKYL